MEQLLDVTQAADILSIGKKKVYRMISKNQLPSLLVGKSIRIPREALNEWIRSAMTDVVKEGDDK